MIAQLIRQGDFYDKVNPMAATANNSKIYKPVTQYRKKKVAADSVHAFELIKETYENAIEYRTIPAQARGLILLFGFVSGFIALWFGWAMASNILSDKGEIGMFNYFALSIVFGMVLIGLFIFLLGIRLELFRPIDEPIIFDRENRKIYRISRAAAPGWKGLCKPWPIHAFEYDWNSVDIEYQLTISTTGSTLTTWHTLLFIVKQKTAYNAALESFSVANPILLSETTIAPFWEHIRRFMEENGPHLPPGEIKTFLEVPKSLWQSMGAVGPFGPNYFHWWKNHSFYSFTMHLFFPLVFPFCFAWAITNWLSYLTAVDIEWPTEVKIAIGSSI